MSTQDLAQDGEKEKRTATSVGCLPNELLLRILVHLDGASIVRCARVCSLWREVVALVLKQGHVTWEAVCRSEIDAEVLDEMLNHQNADCRREPGEPEAPGIDWFAVYRRWYSTSVISKFPHVIQNAQHAITSPVMCVKATGDLVVTGHRDGQIVFWHGRSGCIAMKIHGLNAQINDMALVDPCGCVPRPWFGGLEVFHSTLVYSTEESCIQARQLDPDSEHVLSRHTGYPVTSMRVWDDLLATLSEVRCVLFVLRLVFEGGTLVEFRPLLRVPNIFSACSWIGISEDGVTHVGPKWAAGSINLSSDRWERWCLPQVQSYGPVQVSLALIQRKGLLIVATDIAGLYVSVDSGRHGLWPVCGLSRWQSRATALALCGTLLAVGLESGQLCLYRLRDKSALSDLEYKERPDWTELLVPSPVISVDITSSPSTMRPVVVACTREALFTVHWPFRN